MARLLAIDIDPHGLYVAAGTARTGAAKVEHALAWVSGEEHGPPALTAQTGKEVGEGLRDRLKAAGIPGAPALVAVGRDKIILKEVKYPPVPPTEEPAVVRFQVLKEITEAADDVVLDYFPVADAPPDPATGEVRAVAVVVRKDVLAPIRAMCEAAGLKLAGVTPRPYAVAALFGQALAAGTAPPLPAADAAAAVLTLGPGGGEFTVVRAGQVTFTRSIPAQVMSDKVLLVAEVRRNLTTYPGQNLGQPIKAVYVAEPDNQLGGWADRLDDQMPVPVHAFDPLAGAVPELAAAQRRRFAGAAGLLAGRAVVGGLPINFAAPRQPRAAADPNRKLYIYAAVAALLFLAVGGAFGYWTLAAADREVAALRTEKADLEKLVADTEADRKRLEAADQWTGRGVNYLDELYDLTDRLPANDQLRVTKVSGTAMRPDKAGKQEAQARLDLHVAAKTADAASGLVMAIERDSGAAKYYLGTRRTQAGTANTPHNQLFTIVTMVRRRPPAEYTRSPSFSPPPRPGAAKPR